MKPKILGKYGENYACEWLEKSGYKVITRNFAARFYEIDVIAIKGSTIAYIEVKTRNSFDFYEQYKSISHFKLLKIKRGIYAFINKNPQFEDFEYNICGIMVLINPYTNRPNVEFYEQLD